MAHDELMVVDHGDDGMASDDDNEMMGDDDNEMMGDDDNEMMGDDDDETMDTNERHIDLMKVTMTLSLKGTQI